MQGKTNFADESSCLLKMRFSRWQLFNAYLSTFTDRWWFYLLGAVACTYFCLQKSQADVSPDAPIEWSTSLDAGYMRSQIGDCKMFVFVGTERSDVSRQIWQSLQRQPILHTLNTGYTCIRLNSDALTPGLKSLGVNALPAIRLLAADGKLVASHDGFASIAEFQAWWNDWQKHPSIAPATSQNVDPSIDWLQSLGDSNVAIREAAVRQLLADRSTAPKVIDLLERGTMAQRLSAVDLLEQWGAPTAGIDPWQLSTLTPERLNILKTWAMRLPTTGPAGRPNAVSVGDELDALQLAATEIEARAVRQRLVKYGPSILPQVYERLKNNAREPGRHRLVALRYRLVATDTLALNWPGGFDRLASSDPGIRRAAVSDLVTHARPFDHRLLSELFGDDDPFLRAQSLKLLRSLGGSDTQKELLALLADPEPNVRAAVLDTFAQEPDDSVVPALIRYAAGETNTDLIVHVVHVLELTPGNEAFAALQGMLKHPQWRVRGEAAEAFRGKLTGHESTGVTDEQKTSATNQLVKLLDDPDGYVVTRAAGTLIKSEFDRSVRALMSRVEKRPDLAREVLGALSSGGDGQTYLPQVRRMTASTQPAIRSAAMTALANLSPSDCGDEMSRGLRDPDPTVREAALKGTQIAIKPLIPTTQPAGEQNLFSRSTSVPWADGIAAFRSGKDRPKWLADMEPDLEKALLVPDTRVPAATILCALGRDDLSLPVLLHIQRGEVPDALPAMVWLSWDKKLAVYQAMLAQVGADKGQKLIEAFAEVPDPRATEELWNLLGKDAKPSAFEPVFEVLRTTFLGSNYYNAQNWPEEQKRPLEKELLARSVNGVDMQRSAALAMLLSLSPELAAHSALRVRQDPLTTEWGRIDALQIQLVALPTDQAGPVAVSVLADPSLKKVAIPYLANGAQAIRELRGTVYLSFTTVFNSEDSPAPFSAPAGLDTETAKAALKQTLTDPDQDLAACAAYLLALTGDRIGFDRLVAAWRLHENDPWGQMLYKVIAKYNDDSQTPLLNEIYKGYRSNYYTGEMYQVIRNMTGPNVEKLLKVMSRDLEANNHK